MTECVVENNKVTDLLVRYWGVGKPLIQEEKEILLAALDVENKALRGSIHVRALERMRSLGIV